jgi:hypothetical protein
MIGLLIVYPLGIPQQGVWGGRVCIVFECSELTHFWTISRVALRRLSFVERRFSRFFVWSSFCCSHILINMETTMIEKFYWWLLGLSDVMRVQAVSSQAGHGFPSSFRYIRSSGAYSAVVVMVSRVWDVSTDLVDRVHSATACLVLGLPSGTMARWWSIRCRYGMRGASCYMWKAGRVVTSVWPGVAVIVL